ncbi:MAG: DEAD/DEAH box helicase family protein [Spirochaetaceae bacterium]|nr:DEAD/DEAH box helicase family protein [Spirochaetaceae bacterium]
MNSEKKLISSVCKEYADAIAESGGNEVFAIGFCNEDGIVDVIKICANGHQTAVPVTREIYNGCSVLMHNHPSGNLEPSDNDLLIAEQAAENAQGFYIVNNTVTKVYAVVEPVRSVRIKPLDEDETASFLTAGGALDAISDNFEERPEQIALTKAIAATFNKSSTGVFEAGTGVGKSFAYLLPSVLWSLQNKERVVISTGTINLQQQLIEKDIPLIRKITGKNFKAILLKGRQNYICRRRFENTVNERDMFEDDSDQLDFIIAWNKTTRTGSRSDLSFNPSESLWSRINSESDACMGMRCPYHETCYVMKIRKEASDSNIIIVNHHLLFADIEMRMCGSGYEDTAVLPPFRRIVFDEAHGMENAATSFFSKQVSYLKLKKQLNILYRTNRGAVSGHLFTLDTLSSGTNYTDDIISTIEEIKDTFQKLEQTALFLLDNGFTWRINESTASNSANLFSSLSEAHVNIIKLTVLVRNMIEGIPEKDMELPSVWETKKVLARLEDMGILCKNFTEWQEQPETVFWIRKAKFNGKSGISTSAVFNATPLNIADKMQAGLFEPIDTVICTSATLTTGNSFVFWEKRTGLEFLDKEKILTGIFPSPYHYEKNVLFAVPSDIPLPDSDLFQGAVENAIIKLIESAGGRTLVLFTSFDSLSSAHNYAACKLVSQGINIMKQGDDDRFRLLENFKKDISSVLFATDSFWQGVDVPGDALLQVIIVKLPFSVPSDPVFAARSEALEKQGRNSFMELSIPEAVIKFRQGFGRLIRKSDDRGVVVVLDRRIYEKRYGSIFLNSIPETKRMYSPLNEITDKIARFI